MGFDRQLFNRLPYNNLQVALALFMRTHNDFSNYHAATITLHKRETHGLYFDLNYTFSKSLDDGDSLNQTTAGNAPGLASNPLNLAADKGLATFNASHVGVVNVLYQLPFGRGQSFAQDLGGFADAAVSGWAVSSKLPAELLYSSSFLDFQSF
jgi:hypothetical protein